MVTVTVEFEKRWRLAAPMRVALSSGERYVGRRTEPFWLPSLWRHDLGFRLFGDGVEVMSARRQALTARQRRCGLSERYLFSYEDAPAFTLNQLAGLAELGDFVEYGGQEFVLPTSMSYRLEAVALEVSVLALWQGPSILVSCYRSEHLALAVGLGGYVGLRQWLAFQE